MAIPRPDLGKRPFALSIEREMVASPETIFRAWTEGFDGWFASPGSLVMDVRVDAPYFFETHFEGQRHPHYGRFLQVEPPHLLEMTWLNEAGTLGAETIVRVDFEAADAGTMLSLSHVGFPNAELLKRYEEAWPNVFDALEDYLAQA